VNYISDVTVIVPIYCTTEESLLWLDECLYSAYNQNCEVSVYDDGSIVDIEDIASIYIRGYKRNTAENHGVSYARNRAIEQAKTKLIIPLDCDDRFKLDTVKQMLEYWNNYLVPVYSDIDKFGDVIDPNYTLLDFSCDHILNYVGFTSVNVLHTKSMWEKIGGYDEALKFYEDGDYNARLMGTYCGVRCPKPLIEYRIHKGQRTKTFQAEANNYANIIKNKVRSYKMACAGCGKRRTASNSVTNLEVVQSMNIQQNPDEMALQDAQGFLLAQYIGGQGRGKHWYNGVSSGNAYRVTYGIYLYVDKDDAKEPGSLMNTFFIRVMRPLETKTTMTVVVPQEVQEVRIVSEGENLPIVPEMRRAAVLDVQNRDISKLTLKDVQTMQLTPKLASKLLAQEQNGRNRIRIIEYLQTVIEAK
jgi:hypothetical protein